MARKGSQKVKTGCITCKIRKVKCDEAKPYCERCTKTGRRCDGYTTSASRSVISPLRLQTPARSPSPLVSEGEFRALEFFHHMVAPVISGHIYFDSSFWTHTVQQVSQREPAVRHAAVAISALYERFGTDDVSAGGGGGGGSLGGDGGFDDNNAFALHHYNQAITQLMSAPDETVVLLACILMICVEFLRGNVQTAIEHCRHGISILNNTTTPQSTRNKLMPVFCRLSIFPFFFGCKPASFPVIEGLALPPLTVSPAPAHIRQLQSYLDILMCMCVRFIRTGDEYRLLGKSPVPDSVLHEQQQLEAALQHWKLALDAFRCSRVLAVSEVRSCQMLEMRYLLSVIWTSSALEYDEGVYDKHLDKFRSMVDLAALALASSIGTIPPKFTFEMGYLPILYFVAIKCRCLRTRAAALNAMRALAATRENLWDVDIMYAVGKQVIQLEHGVSIDGASLKAFGEMPEGPTVVPPEGGRIMDLVMDPDYEDDPDGVRRKGMYFILPAAEGETLVFRERISAQI